MVTDLACPITVGIRWPAGNHAARKQSAGRLAGAFQTGLIKDYALVFLAGVAAFLAVILWAL